MTIKKSVLFGMMKKPSGSFLYWILLVYSYYYEQENEIIDK